MHSYRLHIYRLRSRTSRLPAAPAPIDRERQRRHILIGGAVCAGAVLPWVLIALHLAGWL